MGFRFFRRIKVAPGLTVNFSKRGASLSAGPRGAKLTVGSRGARATAGIPGTGLFYTKHVAGGGNKNRAASSQNRRGQAAPSQPPGAEQNLTLGFLEKLLIPASEKTFVNGLREYIKENDSAALKQLVKDPSLADASFLASYISLRRNRLNDAERYLLLALNNASVLGKHFAKYGALPKISLAITDEISVEIGPDELGVRLTLVEIYQRQNRFHDALAQLKRLWAKDRANLLTRLSLIELYMESQSADKKTFEEVVKMTLDLRNESPLHAALLLYRARALRMLDINSAAQLLLTKTIAGSTKYSAELQRALRYERANVYDALGHAGRARKDLERLYAENPAYEDVAARLGL